MKLAVSILLSIGVIANGPVSTESAIPFAAMNAVGDSLTLGDLKALITFDNHSSAFQFKSTSSQDRFSGGLINNPTTKAPFQAIACSNQESYLFNKTRTREFPAGSWTPLTEINIKQNRICSMSVDGHFAVLYTNPVQLYIDYQPISLSFPSGSGIKYDITASGPNFLVLSSKGKVQMIFQNNLKWVVSGLESQPYNSWSQDIRFSASENVFMKADSYNGADIFTLSSPSLFKGLIDKKRLNIRPCDDSATCIPWVSNTDDSWALSGVWGHYIGKDTKFLRLSYPNAAAKSGAGQTIAHQKWNGKFVYLGNLDGDMGSLPSTSISSLSVMDDSSYFVWEKSENRNTNDQGLFVSLDHVDPTNERGLVMRIVSKLPTTIPKNWVAYEPSSMVDFSIDQSDVHSKPFNLPFNGFPIRNKAELTSQTAWWSKFLGIENAWKLANDAGIEADPVHIGIVDSGALITHPALSGNLYKNTNDIKDNRLDDEDDGFVDDIFGYDFVQESGSVVDLHGHGSHCAGLLIGQDKSNGVTASAKNGRLTVVRALDKSGFSNSIDLARGLQYIIDQKIEVVSLSWGGGGLTQSLVDIFKSLRDAGVIVFSSSGNNGISNDPPNTPEVPKLFEGVIGIGAITEAKRVASYSNYGGKSVQFLAPGDQMLSTSKDGSYVILSGTSMACPTAVSSFSFVYGILKARCRMEKCPKSIVELQNLGLELMCQGSDPTGAVAGKSVCGIISTEASTKLALAVSLTQ